MESPNTYARLAGLFILLSVVGGVFGEAYVPGKLIVSGDAAATAHNVLAHRTMYRVGFVTYLLEAVSDVGLAICFYLLLRPAGRTTALIAAGLGLVSTAVFAAAQAFYLAPSLILGGSASLKVFPPEQLDALALLAFRFYAKMAGSFMVFYGVATALCGILIWRSGFLPRFLGALFLIAGLGFVAQNLAIVLAPAYASAFFQAPMAVAGLVTMLWLLFKGVEREKWHAARIGMYS